MRHRFLFFPRRLKRHPPEQRRNRRVASRASSALRSSLKASAQWWPRRCYISTVKQSPGSLAGANLAERSEERRVGKECVSTCRYRWWPYHYKKKTLTKRLLTLA